MNPDAGLFQGGEKIWIGMVHLASLPGSPGFAGSMAEIIRGGGSALYPVQRSHRGRRHRPGDRLSGRAAWNKLAKRG